MRVILCSVLAGVICQTLLPRKGGGMACAREVMVMNSAVSKLIQDNKISQINGAIETGSASGMFSLNQDLAKMVNSGQVTMEEAMLKSMDPQMLQKLIAQTGTGNFGSFQSLTH